MRSVLMLSVLLTATPAMSQDDPQKPAVEKAAAAKPPATIRAPIGHRQPRPSDFAPDQPKSNAADEENERRERELDSKLRICRNC